MWVRLIAILFCVVFFITGCNSLISQFFGTHKLRSFEMEDVIKTGIEDSDYININGAWQTGDYIIVPPKNESDKFTLIYPLLSEAQLKALEQGEQVQPRIIGWKKVTSIECDEDHSCAPKMAVKAEGIIRQMRKQKNKAHMLAADRYQLPDNVDYMEMDREPLAWYWNMLMLIGGLGFTFFIEVRANKKRSNKLK